MSDCEFRDLADVFKCIIDIKGAETFRKISQLENIMSDLAPGMTVERSIMKILSQEGFLTEFSQAPRPDEKSRYMTVFTAKNYLINNIGTRDALAERCVSALAEAFGWNEACDKTEKNVIVKSSSNVGENSTASSLDKQVGIIENESEAPKLVNYGKNGYKFYYDSGKITVYDPERFVLSDKILYSKDYTRLIKAERDIVTAVLPFGVEFIGDFAFKGCTGLTKITIPNSVTEIGRDAFEICTGLTDITIPEGVTKIGNYAFEHCTGLTDITIPESTTKIGDSAFNGCIGLTNVTIPEGVTTINNDVFSGCIGLTNIVIPQNVKTIGKSAFEGCTGLTDVIIPNSVTKIGRRAFEDCRNLKTVIMPEKINGAYSEDDIDIEIAIDAFEGCSGIKETNIKKSRLNFCHFPNTVNIKYPESVDYGEDGYKFDYNSGKVTIYDPVRFVLSDKILYSKDYTQVVKAEEDIVTAVLPFGVTSIGKMAFFECKELTKVMIPESVTEIGYAAFEFCSKLKNIAIPNSVTRIDRDVFAYCTSLTDIAISKGVTKVNLRVFSCCTGLTKITIPEGVREIAGGAFKGCTGLTEITIPEGVKEIAGGAFAGCTGLTKIIIPNSVIVIGMSAFKDCHNLKTVIMPEIINGAYSAADIGIKIDEFAFYGCGGIKETNIKKSRLDFCHFPNKDNIKQIQ